MSTDSLRISQPIEIEKETPITNMEENEISQKWDSIKGMQGSEFQLETERQGENFDVQFSKDFQRDPLTSQINNKSEEEFLKDLTEKLGGTEKAKKLIPSIKKPTTNSCSRKSSKSH